jgi:hypothetical protein
MFPGQDPARYHVNGSVLGYWPGLNLEIEKLYVQRDVSNILPSFHHQIETKAHRAPAIVPL